MQGLVCISVEVVWAITFDFGTTWCGQAVCHWGLAPPAHTRATTLYLCYAQLNPNP